MGCDIHIHAEVKLRGDLYWTHYSKCPGKRCYPLFAKMADVRNAATDQTDWIKPIDSARGLPTDISNITRIESEDDNYHDFSWLSLEEVQECAEWFEKSSWPELSRVKSFESDFLCYILGNGWCKESLPPEYEDIRIVFWFDN